MASFQKYEDIFAWQKGRELVCRVYSVMRKETVVRDFGLRDQIQRAAVSVCSNIAEGFGRRGNREFVKFLWIAKGSATEVSSQLYHLLDLGGISNAEFHELYDLSALISSCLYRLIESISQSQKTANYVRLQSSLK